MKKEDLEENCKKIFNHYGFDNQLLQFCEEVGELIQALNKFRRKAWKANKQQVEHLRKKVVEEISDVYLMLYQFELFFPIYDMEVDEVIDEKVERQIKRVESEVKNDKRS